MGTQEFRERAKDLSQVHWHHTIHLLPDLVVEGAKSAATLEAERAAILGAVDLAGRSVVDVGTWNGYFAFEAKRAGASRVIATDSYVWHSPQFRGRETFELARACLGIDVEAREIDPTDMPGDLEPVDVVLFLGVFYHMIEPATVLQKVASLAKDLLVVETHQDLLALDRPAMVFYPGTTLANDATNWWGPNPECVAELLATAGFCHVFYQRHPVVAERGIYHAFRSAATARRYMRRAADNATLFDLGSEAGRRAIYGGAGAELSTRLAAERDAALAEVAAMRRSTSWALTAPLRGVKRLGVRGLLGRR
jgi:tRNA (mo5U34)-methyltransferase